VIDDDISSPHCMNADLFSSKPDALSAIKRCHVKTLVGMKNGIIDRSRLKLVPIQIELSPKS
jgi:hypothetical protein